MISGVVGKEEIILDKIFMERAVSKSLVVAPICSGKPWGVLKTKMIDSFYCLLRTFAHQRLENKFAD